MERWGVMNTDMDMDMDNRNMDMDMDNSKIISFEDWVDGLSLTILILIHNYPML